jgi:hypothetical protein
MALLLAAFLGPIEKEKANSEELAKSEIALFW